jgi:hypothetical protein
MTRPQWPDPFTALPRSYGLGTISGDHDGWKWVGHSGGFQGYLTRTSVVPAHDIAVSVLTNAADGTPELWHDGALHILKRFQAEGAPGPAVADWAGRWWSVWGPTDLLAMGDKVLAAAPGLANPVGKVPELTITGRDQARITEAGGFASYGEGAHRIRGPDGAIKEVWIAGGQLLPEAELAAELAGKYAGPTSP